MCTHIHCRTRRSLRTDPWTIPEWDPVSDTAYTFLPFWTSAGATASYGHKRRPPTAGQQRPAAETPQWGSWNDKLLGMMSLRGKKEGGISCGSLKRTGELVRSAGLQTNLPLITDLITKMSNDRPCCLIQISSAQKFIHFFNKIIFFYNFCAPMRSQIRNKKERKLFKFYKVAHPSILINSCFSH